MSSSRRRGRSSGSPATGRPAVAVDSEPEAVSIDASADASPIETMSDAEEMTTETAAIPEVPAETSPETVQAAVTESVIEAAEPLTDTVETMQDEAAATAVEASEAAIDQTADAVEPVTEMVAAAQDRAKATIDPVADTAMTLATAPPAAVSAQEATGAKSFAGMASARFVFVPPFEPLNEINATLLAFARDEGEAAMAHLQALTKAKSPAEAIRLQVSEFQRAADASLTCFSHILRSANRFGSPARWN